MKLEAIKRNAEGTIKSVKEAAAAGKDFPAGAIQEARRLLRLVDEVAPRITDEEWARIDEGTPGLRIPDGWENRVKDIKERFSISWNELRLLRFSRGFEKKTSAAQLAAGARYDKQNTKQIMMKLNKGTDADIIEHLGTVGNVQGYIKALIRADMNK